jgi:hypothetical protein
MRRLLAVSTAVAAGALTLPAVAYADTSVAAIQCHATFSQHPESGAGWALDTFARATTITQLPEGKWSVHIKDSGRFTSVPGKPSDGDNSVLIANKVTGRLHGSGSYTVLSEKSPSCSPAEHYNGTNAPTTGQWPLHYFAGGGASTSGIDPWHWDYRTRCEHMVEDSGAGTTGNITGKVCPTPTPTPTPSETATQTPTPEPTGSTPVPSPSDSTPPGEAPAPTPVKGDLAVTG